MQDDGEGIKPFKTNQQTAKSVDVVLQRLRYRTRTDKFWGTTSCERCTNAFLMEATPNISTTSQFRSQAHIYLFECSSGSSTSIILFAFVLERWTRMWSTTRWKRSNATPKINTSTTKTLRLTSWVKRPLMTSSWIELQRHNDNHNIVTICICCTGIVTKHDNKVFKLNYDLDVARSLMKWGQSGSSLAKWAVRYLFVKQKLNIKKYNVQFI